MDLVKLAKEIATEKHSGQYRKPKSTKQKAAVNFGHDLKMDIEVPCESEPYINHPYRVVDQLCILFLKEHNKNLESQVKTRVNILPSSYYYTGVPATIFFATGYLHDVIEDCSVARGELMRSFFLEAAKEASGNGKQYIQDLTDWSLVLDSVELLTKKKENPRYSYVDYLKRIKEDKVAKLVKLADLTDNMSDLDKKSSLYEKYDLSRAFLLLE